MKIIVERHGGVAAIPRVWTVQVQSPNAASRWEPLIEACPWDAVPNTLRDASKAFEDGPPDRFMYAIRAGQRRAALPERAVVGPWRTLVDTTRAAAEGGDQTASTG